MQRNKFIFYAVLILCTFNTLLKLNAQGGTAALSSDPHATASSAPRARQPLKRQTDVKERAIQQLQQKIESRFGNLATKPLLSQKFARVVELDSNVKNALSKKKFNANELGKALDEFLGNEEAKELAENITITRGEITGIKVLFGINTSIKKDVESEKPVLVKSLAAAAAAQARANQNQAINVDDITGSSAELKTSAGTSTARAENEDSLASQDEVKTEAPKARQPHKKTPDGEFVPTQPLAGIPRPQNRKNPRARDAEDKKRSDSKSASSDSDKEGSRSNSDTESPRNEEEIKDIPGVSDKGNASSNPVSKNLSDDSSSSTELPDTEDASKKSHVSAHFSLWKVAKIAVPTIAILIAGNWVRKALVQDKKNAPSA